MDRISLGLRDAGVTEASSSSRKGKRERMLRRRHFEGAADLRVRGCGARDARDRLRASHDSHSAASYSLTIAIRCAYIPEHLQYLEFPGTLYRPSRSFNTSPTGFGTADRRHRRRLCGYEFVCCVLDRTLVCVLEARQFRWMRASGHARRGPANSLCFSAQLQAHCTTGL